MDNMILNSDAKMNASQISHENSVSDDGEGGIFVPESHPLNMLDQIVVDDEY